MISIDFGKREHFDSLKSLYDNHWRPDYVVMRPDFYDWQFRRNPFLPDDLEEGSVMAVEDGEVIAYLGLIPVPFRIGSEVVQGVYPSNWLTHPRIRNRGVGAYLMAKAFERWPVVVGTSLAPNARTIYERLDFRYVDRLHRWILILDPEEAASLLPVEHQSSPALRARTVSIVSGSPAYRVHRGAYGALADRLWDDLTEELPVASVRNARYLNWRYAEHPDFDYEALVVGGQDRWEGLAVVRTERVANSAVRVLRILEFMALQSGQEELALSVIGRAVDEKCAFADAFGLSGRPVRGLLEAGAFRENQESGFNLPFLFQPTDHDRTGMNFVARSSVSYRGAPAHLDLSDWYLSKGDCDQDRPN
jgi:GNAT superfamily N-acetyltransferase